MSWSRESFHLDNWGEDLRKRGYSHKLCPYSTAYRDTFKYTGTLCTGIVNGSPVNVAGTMVIGNSTNPAFWALDYSDYPCSEHTTTSGRMVQVSNPPGWVCDDPNCYHRTEVVSGAPYREV